MVEGLDDNYNFGNQIEPIIILYNLYTHNCC